MHTHSSRIDAIVSSFEEALARFHARFSALSPEAAERVPADGGWSPAQIAWHVAAVNKSFASIIDGSFPVAKPAPDDFVERVWEEIGAGVPAKADAPSRVQPQGLVTQQEALEKLAATAEHLRAALRGLDAERARLTIEAPYVGRLSLYQVGEWASVHLIRHNKQMKRLSGGV